MIVKVFHVPYMSMPSSSMKMPTQVKRGWCLANDALVLMVMLDCGRRRSRCKT